MRARDVNGCSGGGIKQSRAREEAVFSRRGGPLCANTNRSLTVAALNLAPLEYALSVDDSLPEVLP